MRDLMNILKTSLTPHKKLGFEVTPDETDAEPRMTAKWYQQGMYRRITGKSY
jgi:hypothetical protein